MRTWEDRLICYIRCKLNVTYVYCLAQFLCTNIFNTGTSNHKHYTSSCHFTTFCTTITMPFYNILYDYYNAILQYSVRLLQFHFTTFCTTITMPFYNIMYDYYNAILQHSVRLLQCHFTTLCTTIAMPFYNILYDYCNAILQHSVRLLQCHFTTFCTTITML